MLRAVFFDLYGTLVDITTDEGSPETSSAFERWVESRFGVKAFERERAHPFLSDLRAIRPLPVLHAEPSIAPAVTSHLTTLLEREPSALEIDEMAEAFRSASRRTLCLIPGARETLLALRQRFIVGLISNAQLLFTRPELRQVGLEPALFEPLLISSEIGVRKPSKHIFRAALERAGVMAGEALHVGNDPLDDVDGAWAAGLFTCLVDDRRRRAEPTHVPSLRLPSVASLPEAILGPAAPAWARGPKR
ncbi:MAG: HAD family hydrolase [Deltaproteobacteria bacterium]|nr:HAD family hydrolase [Deltaproteobacteria bacterium]